jgi:hypothetical protein
MVKIIKYYNGSEFVYMFIIEHYFFGEMIECPVSQEEIGQLLGGN